MEDVSDLESSRSGSSTPRPFMTGDSESSSTESPKSNSKRKIPPPPPPPRRSRRSVSFVPSISSISVEAPSSDRDSSYSVESSQVFPPLIPARSTPPVPSTANSALVMPKVPISNGGQAPPPPPPRRKPTPAPPPPQQSSMASWGCYGVGYIRPRVPRIKTTDLDEDIFVRPDASHIEPLTPPKSYEEIPSDPLAAQRDEELLANGGNKLPPIMETNQSSPGLEALEPPAASYPWKQVHDAYAIWDQEFGRSC